MGVTIEDIKGYFENFGWPCQQTDAQTLIARIATEKNEWPLQIRISESFVRFVLAPYMTVEDSEEENNASQIFLRMLELNHEMNLAKFSWRHTRDIVLSVDLPSDHFSATLFADAMTALSHYAEVHAAEIRDVVKREKAEVV